MTLGRWIFFSPSAWHMLGRARSDALELLAHEVVHVAQVRRLGLLAFLWRYVSEYVLHRRKGCDHRQAYRSLSAEIEARRVARFCVEAVVVPKAVTDTGRRPDRSEG